MEREIQIIANPETFRESLLNGVAQQLDDFKSHFKPKEPEEYIKRNDLADQLGVDKNTLINWEKSGILVAHKIGNRIYYKRSQVEAAIQPIIQ